MQILRLIAGTVQKGAVKLDVTLVGVVANEVEDAEGHGPLDEELK